MVGGLGSAGADYGTLLSIGRPFVCFSYKESLWRTGESWLCKKTEGGLTAPSGWGVALPKTSGCGLFIYVAGALLHQARA